MTDPACLLCLSPLVGIQVATHARGDIEARRVVCVDCGLCQVVARPSAEELRSFYEESYRKIHRPLRIGDVEPGTPEYAAIEDAVAEQRAQDVAVALGIAGEGLLEIGCGDGRVAVALTAGGFLVTGIEPDAGMRREAGRRGALVSSHIIGADYAGAYAFHALDHAADPVAMLAEIRAAVRPMGKLLIEVPYVEHPYGASLGGWFFQGPHVVDFSRETLTACLLAAGWEFVETVVGAASLVELGAEEGRCVVPGQWLRATAVRPPDGYPIPDRAEACERGYATPHHAESVTRLLLGWNARTRTMHRLQALVDTLPESDAATIAIVLNTARDDLRDMRSQRDALITALDTRNKDVEKSTRGMDHERPTDWHRGCAGGMEIAMQREAVWLTNTHCAAVERAGVDWIGAAIAGQSAEEREAIEERLSKATVAR